MLMMLIIGFAPQDVGNTDESHTIRLRAPCDSPREFTLPRRASSAILTVAWQCADVIVVMWGWNRSSAQWAASGALRNRGAGSGPIGSSEGSSTSRAPAANIT